MTAITIVTILVIVSFLTFVITVIQLAIKREKAIYANGMEVDSVVVENEHYFDIDHRSRSRCYVQYVGNDGAEHKGLLNVRTDLPRGRKVRIKYIPGKYDDVVFVSQELD